MWKSSLFILVSVFLLNDHLSSGNLMSCVKAIEQLPVEILEIPIHILYDIKQLFMYTYCHLGYLTEFMEYVIGCNYCDGYENPSYPMDCFEILKTGQNKSGVYTIWPRIDGMSNKSIDVYCDMCTDGGGWTVLLKRGNFSPQENFSRDWNDYKIGFGDLHRDFWLGNDNIYALSNQGNYSVRFDLEDPKGNKAFAVYVTFRIEDEASLYKLHIENYTAGNVLDSIKDEMYSMGYHNNMKFTTFDKDNDNYNSSMYDCATFFGGGWWYNDCAATPLTGFYNPGSLKTPFMHWLSWKKDGLVAVDMKLRPTPN